MLAMLFSRVHRPAQPDASRTGHGLAGRRSQRGAVLLFTLIALVIMLVAAVALIRSFNTSLSTAGNLAFKRDLQNQAERIVPGVLALLNAGGALSTPAARANNNPALNYSASLLPTNEQGIPTDLLLPGPAFAAKWTRGDETVLDASNKDTGVRIRYLLDRQCRNDGEEGLLSRENCVVALDTNAGRAGGTKDGSNAALAVGGAAAAAIGIGATAPGSPGGAAGAGAVPPQVVYRVSILITGPRKSQAYFQTTFTL